MTTSNLINDHRSPPQYSHPLNLALRPAFHFETLSWAEVALVLDRNDIVSQIKEYSDQEFLFKRLTIHILIHISGTMIQTTLHQQVGIANFTDPPTTHKDTKQTKNVKPVMPCTILRYLLTPLGFHSRFAGSFTIAVYRLIVAVISSLCSSTVMQSHTATKQGLDSQ